MANISAEVACYDLRVGAESAPSTVPICTASFRLSGTGSAPVDVEPAITIAPPEIALLWSLVEYEQLVGGGR